MSEKLWDGTPSDFRQPLEIEVEILKAKLNNLEENQKWLTSNWVDWTKSTKDMGQKLIILFDQLNKNNAN